MSRTPRTILVYTDGEVIGDGIIRLAFAAALKQAAPAAHITWLASGYSTYADALKEMAAPLIDELIIIPDRRIDWRDFLFGPAPLRHRKFDLILDTQRNFKRALWLKRIHHRNFISAAGDFILATKRPTHARPAHFFTMLMELGELGLGQPLSAPALPLPPGDWQAQAAALLPEGKRYIGFVTGAGHPDKCWPLERFIALAQEIAARGDVPVFFLGPQEKEHAAQIRAAVPSAMIPLETHAPSPYLTIALAQRLSAAIANDSGGGHLLAAGDTPLVTLFRSNTVREKFLPRTKRVIALTPEDFGKHTMQEIPLEAVSQALSALL